MWSVPQASGGSTERKARKIDILVCSANMGNQEPDLESLSAWIPKDGSLKHVLEDPKYPLPEGTNALPRRIKEVATEVLRRKISRGTSLVKQSEEKSDDEIEKEKFDMVVIGMQEATFDVQDTGEGMASKFLPSHAIKAQKAVKDLTRGKNHLSKSKTGENSPKANKAILGLSLSQSLTKGDPSNEEPSSKAAQQTSTIDGIPLDADAPKSNSIPPSDGLTSSFNASDRSRRYDSAFTSSDRASIETEQRKGQSDTKILHAMLNEHLPSYQHAVSYQRGQMRLLMFYNQDEISMEVISIKAQNTGKGGLANKGGIVSEVLVDGTTRLAFITAHLEAHEGTSKYETRCSSVADIFRGTTSSITECRCDSALASHFTFAMGDLNFRTRLPDHQAGSDAHILSTHAITKKEDWDRLYTHDELSHAIRNNHCFSGFSTPVCSFPPTFKLMRQKGYVYNEKRSPSYTDRILYTTGHRLEEKIKVLAYEPIDDFATSDHKPIRSAFEVELNTRLKWRPTLSKRATKRMSLSPGLAKRMPKLRPPSKESAKAKKMDRREFLNLFITSIKVEIFRETFRKNSDASSPSPFVCFVSTPAEALKMDTKMWEKVKRTVRAGGKKNLNNIDGTHAWPRTRRKRNSFEASWDNEEVNFKVRTHLKDGMPIDLSGAMIHVAVFDGKSSDKLLGTFSMNLAHLIIQSRQQADLEKTQYDTENENSKPSLLGSTRSIGSNLFDMLYRVDSLRFGNHRRQRSDPSESSWPRNTVKRPSKHKSDLAPIPNTAPSKEESAPLNDEDTDSFGTNPKSKRGRRTFDAISPREGKKKSEGDDDERKEGDNKYKKDEETGVLTVGPSTELMRHATRTWLGSIVHGGAESKRSSFESLNVRSMKLNRPLRKFGIDVGTIQFTVDSWWLSDQAADQKRKERQDGMLTRS